MHTYRSLECILNNLQLQISNFCFLWRSVPLCLVYCLASTGGPDCCQPLFICMAYAGKPGQCRFKAGSESQGLHSLPCERTREQVLLDPIQGLGPWAKSKGYGLVFHVGTLVTYISTALLLFSGREVPHSSVGNSPFEFLYERHTLGILDLMREMLKEHYPKDKNVDQYVLKLWKRLKALGMFVRKKLLNAQQARSGYQQACVLVSV